jgi:DNA mismatch repair ATPase MutS
VVTGPNLSGKSCYAKQVALVIFLAHVGSFVPAACATVGITDRIFTRLVSNQSGSMPQSTFMVDLTQVSTMLRNATSRSTLFLNELPWVEIYIFQGDVQ